MRHRATVSLFESASLMNRRSISIPSTGLILHDFTDRCSQSAKAELLPLCLNPFANQGFPTLRFHPQEDAEAKPKRRGNASLRSRVLAELAKSSAEDVRQRLEGELLEHNQRIAAAQEHGGLEGWVVA